MSKTTPAFLASKPGRFGEGENGRGGDASETRMPETATTRRLLPAAALAVLSVLPAAGQVPIALSVDLSKTLVTLQGRPMGINVNYIKDDDIQRPDARPLAAALKEMGVGWIRYPGGEKSDWHLWSKDPFLKPDPQVFGYYNGQYGGQASNILDFDEYMTLVKAAGAEPYVVVGYDNTRTGITKAQYLKNAVEWVRYANVTKKYGVKHWEIGNENWHNNTGTPQVVARDVAEISKAMKAVDPTIRTGASGNGDSWWNAYLAADPGIDFFTISNYTGMSGGYPTYAQAATWGLLGGTQGALNAFDRLVPAADRANKKVVLAEFNSKDWSNSWPDANNLGHALVNFDNIGQILLQPRIASGMMWNTRWMDWRNPGNSVFYGLDAANGFTAQGRALAIWGQFLREKMVSINNVPGIVAFASASATGDAVNVFLMNKRAQAQRADLSTLNAPAYAAVEMHRFAGTGEADTKPAWAKLASPALQGNKVPGIELPGYSVTVISLRGSTVAIRRVMRPAAHRNQPGAIRYFNLLGRTYAHRPGKG